MRTRQAAIWTALLVAGVLIGAPRARAGDLSGTARVYGGSTDRGDEEEDVLAQTYNFRLIQPLTPWLRLFVGYQSSDFDVVPSDGEEFDRRSSEPTFELDYIRNTFHARLGYQDRRNRGTSDADHLDAASRYAQFGWRQIGGPQYSLRLNSSSNVADVAVFGRDTDTRSAEFDISHVTRTWSVRYGLRDFALDNNLTGFELDDRQHLVQGTYDDRFLEDRLRISTEILLRRSDQTERVPDGQTIAEPLIATEGLGGIDPTPGIGTLPAVPTLIDGDTTTPAVPRLEIGGANPFRNAGLDLGFTRQVTRLEVTVDALSDPSLMWIVYHGPDNLTWTGIGGILSTFDSVLLRYTLEFPETTDRYFKVINVSVNSRSPVAITEIRALVDTLRTGQERRRSTTERIFILTDVRPTERTRGSFSFGYDSDGGNASDLPVRDTRSLTYDARFAAELSETAELRLGFYQSDYKRNENPILRRDERRYRAAVAWAPLPTVDALFTLSRREEQERDVLIRRNDSIRAAAMTDLLPGLRLNSEIAYSDVDDPFSGFGLESWTVRETFEMRPTRYLTFYGGLTHQRFNASGRVSLEKRTSADGRLNWSVLPGLNFGGTWSYGTEDGRSTLTQGYVVNWAPGPRLSMNGSYSRTDSIGDVETSSTGASLNYRLNQYTNMFATYTLSKLNQAMALEDRVSTLQFGLTLAF